MAHLNKQTNMNTLLKLISPLLTGFWNKTKSVVQLLWSKGVAIILLVMLILKYTGLSDAPFAGLIYAGVLTSAVIVIAPIIRFLVFNEAAALAESGKVKELLKLKTATPELLHYWFATFVSYAVTLLCVSSLL